MSNNNVNKSPVDADASSATYDDEARAIVLEQKPGQQPVTIAGGALGPATETDDDGETKAAS